MTSKARRQASHRFAKLALTTLVAIVTTLGATVSRAEETAVPADKWTVSFMPYGWLAFLKGDVTVKGQTVGLDINPIQVFEYLERPFWFSYAEARKGRLTQVRQASRCLRRPWSQLRCSSFSPFELGSGLITSSTR